MKDKKPFKVGDKIVDFGQVYRILKIEKRKNAKGEEEKVIHFKPHFKTKQNKSLVCSIPVKNIDLAHIRRPISKKELKKLLKELSKKPEKKTVNTKKTRDALNLNDPYKTAQVLRKVWADKNDESTSFTKAKSDIFSLSMKRLVEEVALVEGVSVAKARKKIRLALKKGNESENSVH